MPELHHYAINALRLAALHLSYWLATQGSRVFNHIERVEVRCGAGPGGARTSTTPHFNSFY